MTSRPDRTYRIGEIAVQAGVSVEALRYYERLGLLPAARRTDGGARRFGGGIVSRIRFIKQAQKLGLSLREVRELSGDDPRRTPSGCRRVHALVTRHLERLDRRLAELRTLRRSLDQCRRRCEGALDHDAEPPCPALATLAGRQ